MQTLNVGAGRTDKEYEAAEEQRRAVLLVDSRSDADYFFWAAGLAAIATGLFPLRLGIFINIIVRIGVFDLMKVHGGVTSPLAIYGVEATRLLALTGLGFAARKGYRWAFFAGIVLYGADMIALMLMFSVFAFGVHAFFLFRWFRGQKALKDLNQAGVLTF